VTRSGAAWLQLGTLAAIIAPRICQHTIQDTVATSMRKQDSKPASIEILILFVLFSIATYFMLSFDSAEVQMLGDTRSPPG
jgi:hypothetical protein